MMTQTWTLYLLVTHIFRAISGLHASAVSKPTFLTEFLHPNTCSFRRWMTATRSGYCGILSCFGFKFTFVTTPMPVQLQLARYPGNSMSVSASERMSCNWQPISGYALSTYLRYVISVCSRFLSICSSVHRPRAWAPIVLDSSPYLDFDLLRQGPDGFLQSAFA